MPDETPQPDWTGHMTCHEFIGEPSDAFARAGRFCEEMDEMLINITFGYGDEGECVLTLHCVEE